MAAYCVNSHKPHYTRFKASKIQIDKGKKSKEKGTSASDPGTVLELPPRTQSMRLQLALV